MVSWLYSQDERVVCSCGQPPAPHAHAASRRHASCGPPAVVVLVVYDSVSCNGPRRLSASDRRACFKRLGRNSPQRHVSPTVEQNATAGGPQEACRREAAWACGAGGCTHSRFSVSDCSFPWIPFAHQEGGLALPSAARMAGATGRLMGATSFLHRQRVPR